MKTIKIAGIIKESIVDGPGIRYVVFTQGCIHNCRACHNPETHSFDGGYDKAIDEIIKEILDNPLLDGITLSGGDPFVQPRESYNLCKKVKEKDLNTIVYTGYLYEDLINEAIINQSYMDLLSLTDILIDGPYIEEEKDMLLKFRGSRNQRIIDVKKSLLENKTVEIEL